MGSGNRNHHHDLQIAVAVAVDQNFLIFGGRFGHQRRGPTLLLSENWERLNRSVAACVGRPSTATAIWLHIAVENRCRWWGPIRGWTCVGLIFACICQLYLPKDEFNIHLQSLTAKENAVKGSLFDPNVTIFFSLRFLYFTFLIIYFFPP